MINVRIQPPKPTPPKTPEQLHQDLDAAIRQQRRLQASGLSPTITIWLNVPPLDATEVVNRARQQVAAATAETTRRPPTRETS